MDDKEIDLERIKQMQKDAETFNEKMKDKEEAKKFNDLTILLGKTYEDKPKFMEKYGTMIVNLAAIIVICVFLYLIVDKIVSVSGSVRGMVEMSGQVMEKAKDVVIALNNVCTSKGVVA